MTDKMQLLGLYPDELKAFVTSLGQPAFRADQLFAWLHKGVPFQQMSNLPQPLRDRLDEAAVANPVAVLERQVSRMDGTRKYLFALPDGHCVEGVWMRYRHGCTACLSTQVGCSMGCVFCASTLQGCARNLTAAEMMGQALALAQDAGGDALRNIVLMGSGEPFRNYDQVVRFIRLATHPKGMDIGVRHISLSTCGLVEQMLRFAEEGLPVTLSVSLHAPDDALRQRLMPVARKYALRDVLDACRTYIEKTGRRVIFEYALIRGVNSEPRHAEALANILRGMQCHVNLIPLNDVPERGLQAASPGEISAFSDTLRQRNISVSIRREMGDDISGACGQLRRRYIADGAGQEGEEAV